MKPNSKNTPSNFRRKRQLQPVSQKQTKTPFLLQHSKKLENKLSKLKQEISQKKKDKKPTQTNIQIDPQLVSFLDKLGLKAYTQKMYENGIDSMEILKQIKQKELEEIEIPKGHALKICVHLKKISEAEKKQKQEPITLKPKQVEEQKVKVKEKPLQIIIQTDVQMQPVKKYFCLYCYRRAMSEFCDQLCEGSYNKMFERYENNLRKAEEMFVKPAIEEQQVENEEIQIINDFDYLIIEEEDESFDRELYEQALKGIKESDLD